MPYPLPACRYPFIHVPEGEFALSKKAHSPGPHSFENLNVAGSDLTPWWDQPGRAAIMITTRFHTVGSTHQWACNMAAECTQWPVDLWHIGMADRQLQGHGQHGRAFASPSGGLYVTCLVPWPHAYVSPLTSLWVAGVVAQICQKAAPSAGPFQLKWPNDVYTRTGKKVAGTLVESLPLVGGQTLCCLSFGLNVNSMWPEREQPSHNTFPRSGTGNFRYAFRPAFPEQGEGFGKQDEDHQMGKSDTRSHKRGRASQRAENACGREELAQSAWDRPITSLRQSQGASLDRMALWENLAPRLVHALRLLVTCPLVHPIVHPPEPARDHTLLVDPHDCVRSACSASQMLCHFAARIRGYGQNVHAVTPAGGVSGMWRGLDFAGRLQIGSAWVGAVQQIHMLPPELV